MNTKSVLAIAIAALAAAAFSSAAPAQERTRAEVRQELIQAEHDGSKFVSDTSYPDAAIPFQQQAARMKQQASADVGGTVAGSSDSGAAHTTAPSHTNKAHSTDCVGPAGFCVPYFGN